MSFLPNLAHADWYRTEEFEKKYTAIKAELETLPNHDWAGNYHLGRFRGSSLQIAPKAGAIFANYGCFGGFDENWGKVTEKDGRVYIQWEIKPDRRGIPESEFLVVRWGELHYLIPPSNILNFCIDVRKVREPYQYLSGLYYVRDEKPRRSPVGAPIVPKGFERYLSMDHIKATITTVRSPKKTLLPDQENWERATFECRINAGSKNGILPGMRLWTIDEDTWDHVATVTKVRENECDVEFGLYQDPRNPVSPPKVNWKISTESNTFRLLERRLKQENPN